MTIFENVKSSVSLTEVAEKYGIKITGNSMICCPFHNDRHPSMKLNTDYYYCFSCGATGDVIDFAGELLGLKPIDAARRLAADFSIDTDNSVAKPLVAVKHPKVKAFREDELYCFKIVCDYLHILEDWRVKYAPTTPDEEYDDRFVEACQMIDYITFWADILTVGTLEDRMEVVKNLFADGKMQDLEKKVKRMQEEEKNEQHTED